VGKLGRVFVAMAALVIIAAPGNAENAGHCVLRLVPLHRVGGVVDASLELVGCYPSYEEAIEAGLGGSADLVDGITPLTLTDEMVASDVVTSVLIGTEYDLKTFLGESTSYAAPTTCSSSTSYQVANVGAYWNDRFQSGKGFGGCDTNRKFQHENFGGTVRVCTPNCSDYGALSNQVTSLRWRV
jgi:hypothetical protein